jgi:hypothetical protein
MKRVLFLLVSAFMTCTAFASNLSKDVIAKVTNNDVVSVTKQGQTLILEQPMSGQVQVNSHQSHRSHSSHRSHYSSRMN